MTKCSQMYYLHVWLLFEATVSKRWFPVTMAAFHDTGTVSMLCLVCPSPFLLSHFLTWGRKMLPPVRYKTRWSSRNFVNFITPLFSAATCGVHLFHSTTRSVQASGTQRMMGMQEPLVTVIPTSLGSTLLYS